MIRHMLRRFLYLDTMSLAQYISSLEGGLANESTNRATSAKSGEGGLNVRVAHFGGAVSREIESSQTLADTHEARFDRLLYAANVMPEKLAWINVLEPSSDFEDIGIGAMVSWECDVFVPDILQTMSRSGDALSAIKTMTELFPAATNLGLDIAGLPTVDEMNAVGNFISGLNAGLFIVGEDEDTDWRIAGQIVSEYQRGDIEGRARVVGKVSEVLRHGHWKPYLTFPGMKVLSRDQRRKKEREKPEEGTEDQYLPGPAVMLDILAIFR